MFVDASALVAILTEEEDGRDLAAALDAADDRITWRIAVWEDEASISRKTGGRAGTELPDILSFLDLAGI